MLLEMAINEIHALSVLYKSIIGDGGHLYYGVRLFTSINLRLKR